MNGKILVSKKNIYIVLFIFFVFLLVVLSQLALRSNQANNSKAAETKNSVQLIPTSAPPSPDQQSETSSYKASRDVTGYIELLGTPPQISENSMYSIYSNKNGIFTHIDTFVVTQQIIEGKFLTFWKPQNPVSSDDVQNAVFYLFRVK